MHSSFSAPTRTKRSASPILNRESSLSMPPVLASVLRVMTHPDLVY